MSETKIHLKTTYTDDDAILVPGRYGNGTTAIQAFTLDGELITVATVALDYIPDEGNVLIKDWSENEGVYKCLYDNGIVGEVVNKVPTGFVTAIEVPLLVEL